jgi:hydrogenase expression/formation protein HypC
MCLAIPAKILNRRQDNISKVDFGGVIKEVDVTLVPEASVGDYVLVHAGFAIGVVEEKEALETLELLRQMAEQSDASDGEQDGAS